MSDFFEDIGRGITDAVNARTEKYRAETTSDSPESGNTAAYFGRSIVDVASDYLKLGKEAAKKSLVEKFSASGTGSELISEARRQEIQKFLNNPVVWLVALGILGAVFMLGRRS